MIARLEPGPIVVGRLGEAIDHAGSGTLADDTVTVLSVVGPYLEHSRIYYFRNGGDERYYIASADCMRRNLQREHGVDVADWERT